MFVYILGHDGRSLIILCPFFLVQMLMEPSFILESAMVRVVTYMVVLDIKGLLNVAQLIKFILKIQITQFQYSVPFPSTTLVP